MSTHRTHEGAVRGRCGRRGTLLTVAAAVLLVLATFADVAELNAGHGA